MVTQNQKQREHKNTAPLYKYLRNKQVEVAKVFEFTKENIEFGRSV